MWLAKCEEEHQKDDIIEVENKYGNINESIIQSYIKKMVISSTPSPVLMDITYKRAKRKAEQYSDWADSAQKKRRYVKGSIK